MLTRSHAAAAARTLRAQSYTREEEERDAQGLLHGKTNKQPTLLYYTFSLSLSLYDSHMRGFEVSVVCKVTMYTQYIQYVVSR